MSDLTPLMLTRAAAITLASFDKEANTIEAIISTFSDVQRQDARGPFLERLDSTGLDTSDLTGSPVLDGHRQGSGRDVIGVIDGHRMEGNQLIAVIRFSKTADAQPVIERILEGTLRGVSVGYVVKEWGESIDPQSKARVKTARTWSISETSAVPLAADSGAKFRSAEMPTTTTIEKPSDDVQRRSEIRTLVRSANLDPEVADQLIDADATVERAKAEIFDATQTRAASTPIIRVHQGASNDDPAVIVTRQADALATRMGVVECPDESKQYLGTSLMDMARSALTRSGVAVNALSQDEVLTRALGTSDFPLVVSNAMGKTALDSYTAAASPLKALAKVRQLTNFKSTSAIRLGELGALEPLDENGEITHTDRAESGESLSLSTYARALNVSRELIINDDLNLLGDMTAAFGQSAAALEANKLATLLLSNPAMSDGKAVFHADHSNLATGATLDAAGLSTARLAMRKQTGLDGKTLIRVTPRFLIVGPELETQAEQLLATIHAAKTGDVQPISLTLLVEPRISGTDFYVAASDVAFLQIAYLASAPGPQIQQAEAWETLGMKYRAYLDFGCGVLDFRGAHKSAA